jgi:peroxiredoxin
MVKTYMSFKDKGFEIFGVSLDQSKEHWIQAIKTDGLIWPNVSELNGAKNSAALIYGISGIPDNFLIDETGTIIDRNLRGEKLNEKLRALLK